MTQNATSYSEINTFQRCPKLAQYRYDYGIQPKTRSVNLTKGIEAHEILKDFFLGLQNGLTMDAAWEVAEANAWERIEGMKSYTFEDELFDVEKEVEVLLWILQRYVDRYRDEWEILHVEETFYLLLDGGETISFTPDLVVRDRNGTVWIVDHKTTSRIPDGGLPFGDTQALLYLAGVKSLYPETAGFIFNRIRKKIPTQPRLTKRAPIKVYDLARIDTTYEILRDFLKAEAPRLLEDGPHLRRLAELRDQPDRWFWTETVYASETQLATIVEEAAYWYRQYHAMQDTMVQWPRVLREDNGWNSCSRCSYQQLCYAELVGWDTDSLLESTYELADPKNPYEGEIQ